MNPDYTTATVEAAAAVAALDPEPEEYWPPEEHWPPEDDREPGALDDDRDDCGCPDPGCPCDGRKRGGAP